MANVAEGLTVDGEHLPSGDLSDSAFTTLVAEQAGKTPPAPQPGDEPGRFYEASRAEVEADGDSIRQAILSEGEASTDWPSGITTAPGPEVDRHGHTAREHREIRERYEALQDDPDYQENLRRGRQLNERQAEGEVAIEQLALRDFTETWNDPYASDERRVLAARALQRQAPAAYVRALQVLDDEFIGDAWDDEELDDSDLPSVRLHAGVEQLAAREQLARVTRQADQLAAHIQSERLAAIKSVYGEYGISDPAEIEQVYTSDRDALADLGVDLATLDGQGIREALETLRATREEFAIEDSHNLIRAQIAGAETTDVSAGYTTMVLGHEVPLVPQPDPVARRSPEELKARIDARLRANTNRRQPVRRSDFHREVLESDSTDWRDGIEAGGLKGQRALELADGSREQHEREMADARAAAISAAGW